MSEPNRAEPKQGWFQRLSQGLSRTSRQMTEQVTSAVTKRPLDQEQLDALEEKFHNPKAKVSYDILAQKGGAQLYSQLASLFETAKDADGAPTEGLRDVFKEQAGLLEQYEKAWKELTESDLKALNERAGKLGYPIVIVPAEKAQEKEEDMP